MARIFDDCVVETTTTTGTGALSLAGAVTGFKRFNEVMTSPSDTCYYLIEAIDGSGNRTGEWESGLGTYSAANQLTRTTVHKSSNSNNVVTLSAGTKRVMICATASMLMTSTWDMPIMAAAMSARATSGAAPGLTETTTNKVMVPTMDFDKDTDEFAQIMVPMPKSWDEGTITVQFLWTATTTGTVIWAAQAVALSDDDALDTAFGTAQTVSDAVTAAGDLMVSSYTSAITVAGSPADNDVVVLQVYRDADDGSDNLAADAKLIGVRVRYTTSTKDDA